MIGMQFFIAVIVAFSVSALLCYMIVSRGITVWLDHPDERSLHQLPVSRLGGVAIWAGIACAMLVARQVLAGVISIHHCAAAVMLLVVALLDDRKGLHPLLRFLVQAAAAVLLVHGENVYFQIGWMAGLWPCLGVVVLMWGINLYNFMDGMDGFAGLMGVIGFSTLAIFGMLQGQPGFALACGIFVAACAGFLCFNFPPARIFMGDSGSTLLGLAMGVFSIQGWRLGLYPCWVPAIIFSPFWVDATLTLIRRLWRGEKIWLPHRQHTYQRWVLAGYSHRQVVGIYSLLMLACAASAIGWHLAGQRYNAAIIPAGWVLGYCLIFLYSEYRLKAAETGGKGNR